MSPGEHNDFLIEAAVGAHRDLDTDGLPLPSTAWADLDDEGRLEVLRRQLTARTIDRARDPRGWSSTVHAVLRRVSG